MFDQDKILHALAGVAVFGIASPFGVGAALAATLAAGVGKEVWDHYTGGDVDVADAIATVLGGLGCYALLIGAHII